MMSLNMGNSVYELTRSMIDKVITRTGPGNYALGYADEEGRFRVNYVGRADSDVAGQLKQHIGERYKCFKFCYASSPMDVFLRERIF